MRLVRFRTHLSEYGHHKPVITGSLEADNFHPKNHRKSLLQLSNAASGTNATLSSGRGT